MLARFLYRSYARFYIVDLWRIRHLTPAGVMILVALFLSGLLGFNILKTNLYQVLAFNFSAMFISLLFRFLPFRFKVTIKRILPEYVTIGDKVVYEIEIKNLSSKRITNFF